MSRVAYHRCVVIKKHTSSRSHNSESDFDGAHISGCASGVAEKAATLAGTLVLHDDKLLVVDGNLTVDALDADGSGPSI